MDLHRESIDVGANIKVTFEGAFYMAGRSAKGPWACLEIRFADRALFLKEKWFQPDKDAFIERDQYAYKLRHLLDVLGEGDRWNNIPKVKNSWKDFYTMYIGAIADCKGKTCYIKTVPKMHYKEQESYQAITADDNYIALVPTLVYSVLEKNQLDYYSIEEPTPEAHIGIVIPHQEETTKAAAIMKPKRKPKEKKQFPF